MPFMVLASLLAGLFAPKARRTADEVARYLRQFIEGTGGEWGWDDFESVPIADAGLEDIRQRAVLAGPPDTNVSTLKLLLAEAESLANPGA